VVGVAADGRRAASGRVQLPPPPPIPGLLSASPTTVSPGDVVTLTGNNLGGVTSVRLLRSLPGTTITNPAVTAPATAVTATSLRFTVPLTADMRWAREALSATVTTSNGTATLTTPMTLDRQAVITGVERAVVRAGRPITVNGRNLDRVNAGYIGVVAPGTTSNPKMAASGSWQGLSAILYTTADCNRQGGLMLEEYPPELPGVRALGTSIVVPSGTPIQVGCGMTPTGTSVTPSAAAGGTPVVVGGKGFTWITDVVVGSTQVPWQRVSDTELHLTLPVQPSANGTASAPFMVSLLNIVPDGTVAGSITPAPVILLPPTIAGVYPTWGETGMPIDITGHSLGQPAGNYSWLPAVTPIIKINGTQVLEVRSLTPDRLTINPGIGTTSGPITVTTGGGTATSVGTFLAPSGPTVIQSLSAASGRGGDVITVTGQNLVRARGVCFPPFQVNTLGQAFSAKAGDFNAPTSNTTFQVTVPAGAASGAIGFATAPSVTQPQFVVCVANPNPVTFTVTP